MRSLVPVGLTLLVLLGLPRLVSAQLEIADVRVGFRATGGDLSYFKAGAWAPVLVRMHGAGTDLRGGRLVVETWDSDDVPNRYTVPLLSLGTNTPRSQPALIATLARPGSLGADLVVRVVDKHGRKVDYAGRKDYEALDFSKQLYLTVGAQLPDLDRAVQALETDPARGRSRYVACADSVTQLPRRWFGYEAVDLLVFTTADRAFLEELLNDREGRREALAEWVRHGGRLVLSVLRNRDLVARLLRSWRLSRVPLLSGRVSTVERLDGLVQFAETQGKPFEPAGDDRHIQLADLRIGGQGAGPLEVLAEEGQDHPLLVRLPHGLGSVTLVALDLDREPFTAWEGRGEFWRQLVAKLGPRVVATVDDNHNDIATDLQKELEVFPGVRPVSFGWVAFLIFLFILAVGPLDYLFLSKVLKRLGWTWITFPALVILVSAAAYSASDRLTDQGLQVNKVDLIDVDQLAPEPRVLGTTWFTLFSPRIGRYTVGVEPAAPHWSAVREAESPRVVVSWLGRPEFSGLNSTGRRRSARLFRTTYAFEADAAGLRGVPMPHASTRSFTATWEASLPRPFTAALVYDRVNNPDHVSGTVTSHLPAELRDAVLFYGGKWYPFAEPLRTNRKVSVADRSPQDLGQWQTSFVSRRSFEASTFQAAAIVNNLLFHEKLNVGRNRRDNTLRRLDQSWRLRDPNPRDAAIQEAVLYARLPRLEGPAEEIARNPAVASRLWLGQGHDRTSLAGTLTQDTYIRVFLPVRPRK